MADDLAAGLHAICLGGVALGDVLAPVPVEGLGVHAEHLLDDRLPLRAPALRVLERELGVGLLAEALPDVLAEAVALLV
ncbi:MAG: hypothetical protein ACK56F_17505, partial [bacterium]